MNDITTRIATGALLLITWASVLIVLGAIVRIMYRLVSFGWDMV